MPGQSVGAFFDHYVAEVFPARRAASGASWSWPGDEWVDDEVREATFSRILGDVAPGEVRRAVEFGPGSGKYTQMLLERTSAAVVACEISAAFADALRARCAPFVDEGRLTVRLSDWSDNEGVLREVDPGGLGEIDLVFAIDMFLMMDFQSVLVYLISAARMLRRGGRLFATFGDGASETGWERMLRDAGRHSAFNPAPSTRFHWLDRTLLEAVLPRLGFGRIEIAHGPAGGLDIARLYVGAELVDPGLATTRAPALAPVGDSTNRRAASRVDQP